MIILSGIDPGWKNLGFSRITIDEETGKPTAVAHGTLNPSELGVVGTIEELRAWGIFQADYLTMERYVPYSGQQNPDSERILMVTGACFLAMGSDDKVVLKRAIDWKAPLCKYLFKNHGFRNPSPIAKLDKEFSMAAAHCLFGREFPTDHEADASCLAFLPRMIEGPIGSGRI